jgi:GTP cyclohydrolase II
MAELPEDQASLESVQQLAQAAEAFLPTRWGPFKVLAFEGDGQEYGVLVRGEVAGKERVPVRLHSECFTGDVMGSLRCDCRQQLEGALQWIAETECGVIVYLPQEGRGIGLANKIRAYALQDSGLDTVEANLALGFPDDMRRYDSAAAILKQLRITSIALLTNNPTKVQSLKNAGIVVAEQLALKIPPNEHNARYLATKRIRSGHML